MTALLMLNMLAPIVRADIYQWEYVNPANPNEGKRQSATVVPDGVGVNAEPGAQLANRNLTKAYLVSAALIGQEVYDSDGFLAYRIPTDLSGTNLSQADLAGAFLDDANLVNANLRQANLTNARFHFTKLTDADFGNSDVRGAFFLGLVGAELSAGQLYSTQSYQDHDLTGIQVISNHLSNLQLGGQNLTNASFGASILNGANLSSSDARGGQFYYTNLSGADFAHANLENADFDVAELSGANFTGAKLSNVNFTNVILTGADFSGADIRGANFSRDHYSVPSSTGITAAQLSSTASFQAHDLRDIKLGNNNLAGINLAGQNLTNSNLAAEWGCDENGCVVFPGADLTGADLNGADTRGANFQMAVMTDAVTSNLIEGNGHIAGLDLTAGKSLVVRDYEGNPAASPPSSPLPIVVDQQMSMDYTGSLRIVFDADAWDSTISFTPGISVTRAGTLALDFAPEVNVAAQIGRTLRLFNWSGVAPTGTFNIASPYAWNLSKLYTTGEATLLAVSKLPGDFNGNGIVDAADYSVWRNGLGSTYTSADYDVWKAHFGQAIGGGSEAQFSNFAVPEPASAVLLALGAVAMGRKWSRCGKRPAFNDGPQPRGTVLTPISHE
ncbi:MAG: pentapeptide repeat-containing protein [Pirellulales bacterium]